MFERMSRGWELMRESWGVLKMDKEMLVFPAVSGIACLLVLASFAAPLWNSEYLQVVMEEEQLPQDPIAYAILFLFYLANYFVIIYFNSALVACAVIRFKGGDPTVGDGFRMANQSLPQIFGWALVSATVGLILKLIESRSERAGQIVAGLMGMAWSAVTYFVVPVIVVERVGPIEATKRSMGILRKTWGEALTANFGIGLITTLVALLGLIPIFLGVWAIMGGMVVLGGVAIAAGVLWFILISLITSALNAIVIGALYLYAAEGQVPSHFNGQLLQDAFSVR
jgi:hypothetical protein